MKTDLLTRTLCAAALLALSSSAQAQLSFFPNDATIDFLVSGSAIVGYANEDDYNNRVNGTSPTVALVTGGSVDNGLLAYNSSIVNLSGGISSDLHTNDTSTLNLTSGSVSFDLHANNSSIVNVSGGSVGGFLRAFNSSIVNVSGGNIGGLDAFGSSSINLTGGNSNTLSANDTSTINYSGGTVSTDLISFDSSTLTLTGTGLAFTASESGNYFGRDGVRYTLAGSLLDGTDVTGKFAYALDSGSVVLVPGPSSLVPFLLGISAFGFHLRRRKQ